MDNLDDVEDLISLWNFDESNESIDDLKWQLQWVKNELAEARREAIEQATINKNNVKKLIHLLGITYKQRDDAKHQLRKLLMFNTHHTLPPRSLPKPTAAPIMTANDDTDKSVVTPNRKIALLKDQLAASMSPSWNRNLSEAPTLPPVSPKSPLMMINNNLITANHSNTPSSSSVDSFFDVKPPLELYSMGNENYCSSSYDQTSSMLDNLAKKRPRPEKGRLLESVMEAGPLLDSLLVAGSLPKWSSPPQLERAAQVPPVPFSMSKQPRYNESLEY